MGTTIKKNFKTEVRLVQLNTNQQETQRLLLVDGQYSAPLLIENNTIKLISVNGNQREFPLDLTLMSSPTKLQRVDPEGRFLYRHSINEPIEIKNRRN